MSGVVLVCNRGFEDLLTLGRQHRADPWALRVLPSPWPSWLPEADRLGLDARLDASGREVSPLEEAALEALVQRVRQRASPPRAIAVCLLHALRQPLHEQRVAHALRGALGAVRVVCSHELPAPPATEFERTVATVRAAWGPGCPLDDAAEQGAARTAAFAPQGDTAAAQGPTGFAREMEALCDAMQAAMAEHAASSISREAGDCAAALLTPDGRIVAQARSLPLLLGSLGPAVRGVLTTIALQDMREGDAFLSNDPWSGGTHLPDLVLTQPVFEEGRVIALLACVLHHQDVGGLTPGSVPTEATCIQHEGLRIPPVRAWHAGQPDAGLLGLVESNSRAPLALRADLSAQKQALDRGAAALQAWVHTHGAEAFAREAGLSLSLSSQAARAALGTVPDGQWTVHDALDGDGLDLAPVPLSLTLHKRGTQAVLDLRDCAPQTRGPVNASRGAVHAAVYHFARMLAPQAAANDGCLEPLVVHSRPGTVVDPHWPAALNARTNLVKLLANLMAAAWGEADPSRAGAAHAGVAVVLSFSGVRDDGTRWVMTEILASAAGAGPQGPGASGVATDVGNTRNTPAEVLEAQAPLRLELAAVRRGSGGSGRHRGGDGIVRRWRLLEGTGLVSYRGERHRTAAPGAAGGLPGACGVARLERSDGSTEPLPAKATVRWTAGDCLVVETAGAGGWGPPG